MVKNHLKKFPYPDIHQNLINSSLSHTQPVHKCLYKFIHKTFWDILFTNKHRWQHNLGPPLVAEVIESSKNTLPRTVLRKRSWEWYFQVLLCVWAQSIFPMSHNLVWISIFPNAEGWAAPDAESGKFDWSRWHKNWRFLEERRFVFHSVHVYNSIEIK